MGKKKGRQSGQFSSKSKRAAHVSELNEAISEVRLKNSNHNMTSSNKVMVKEQMRSQHSHGSANYCRHHRLHLSTGSLVGQERKVVTSMSRLKGLLRERLLEDRALASHVRRQQWLFSTNSGNHPDPETTRSRCLSSMSSSTSTRREEEAGSGTAIGWILSYEHREYMAGIREYDEEKKRLRRMVAPSLEDLCLKELGSVLKDYISYFGRDYMHHRMEFFTSDLLSSLSKHCHDINNDIAFVLGNHAHLEHLVLHSKRCPTSTTATDQSNAGDECCCLNDEAFLPLIPQMALKQDEEVKEEVTRSAHHPSSDEEEVEEESWETLDLDGVGYQGCWKLERLEIRDYQATVVTNLIHFLGKCPRITHLSLSCSLTEVSGPKVLFARDCCTVGCYDDMADVSTTSMGGTIVDKLCNLQVLDLSGCSWVSYDILYSFVSRLKRGGSFVPLELINVKGCCSLTEEMCQSLSASMNNGPIVSKQWK